MALDIQRLTLGEVAKIEELSGQSITSIGDDIQPKGNALAAMAFVAKRREDKKFSWNDAQSLTFEEANAILGLTEDDSSEEHEADAVMAVAKEAAGQAAGKPQSAAKKK